MILQKLKPKIRGSDLGNWQAGNEVAKCSWEKRPVSCGGKIFGNSSGNEVKKTSTRWAGRVELGSFGEIFSKCKLLVNQVY